MTDSLDTLDMSLPTLIQESYENARDHGFWDGPEQDNVPSKLMLMVSELAEALESFRDPASDQMVKVPAEVVQAIINPKSTMPDRLDALAKLSVIWEKWQQKPRGFDIEVADALIRIFDLCGAKGINIEEALRTKMAYNRSRPHRHGRRV